MLIAPSSNTRSTHDIYPVQSRITLDFPIQPAPHAAHGTSTRKGPGLDSKKAIKILNKIPQSQLAIQSVRKSVSTHVRMDYASIQKSKIRIMSRVAYIYGNHGKLEIRLEEAARRKQSKALSLLPRARAEAGNRARNKGGRSERSRQR